MTREQGELPLQDIRVLDLTRLIPGAFCTSILGDYGADVIKVEKTDEGDYERQIPPFIDSMASRFLILNRNKKSIVLDLKKVEGREIFLKMVAEADVLVEGFRPGTMKKLGLDYESLKEINRKLIYCSISSFGQSGPYRDIIAHDINILGMAGFFDVTGMKGGPPVIPGIQIADSIAGMNAALGILMALFSRKKTNKGQYVDTSMFDGMLSWMFDAVKHLFAGEEVPQRGEGRLWGGLPNYNLYKTKDERYMAVGPLEMKFKNELLKKLGREDLVEEREGVTSTEFRESDRELHAFLRKTFLTKTRDEWMAELGKLNICVTPVSTLGEALSHPQTLSRKMVLEVEHPLVGKIKQMGSPLKFSDIRPDINRYPAPRLGEHTREILRELGFAESRISELAEEKIIQE